MAKRYCGMCDKLVPGRECKWCGADTDKWPEPIKSAAEKLRDLIDRQHAVRVGEILGCRVVVLGRHEVQPGVSMPVLGVPVEFLESARMHGLIAEAVKGA